MTAPRTLETVLEEVGALLLDVDDTIVDTREAMVVAGADAAAAIWPERAGDHRAMAQRYYDDPEHWFPRYAAGEVHFDAMRAGRLREVARAFGAELTNGAHLAFEDAYAPAFRRSQRLFPDVPALLEAASAHRVPVALLTNSAAAPTRVKLETLELLDRFDAVVTTDTLGFGKPDPLVYLEACRLVGVNPEGVVCIGDSLEWDVIGAQAAGLRGIWLDRLRLGTTEDVVTVNSLDQVATALVRRFGPPPADPVVFLSGSPRSTASARSE